MILEKHRGENDRERLNETPLKLNPGNIERWEREEKLSGSSVAQNGKIVAGSSSKAADQSPPERALLPLREIFEISVVSLDTIEQLRKIWDMANIPGSPNLKGFY